MSVDSVRMGRGDGWFRRRRFSTAAGAQRRPRRTEVKDRRKDNCPHKGKRRGNRPHKGKRRGNHSPVRNSPIRNSAVRNSADGDIGHRLLDLTPLFLLRPYSTQLVQPMTGLAWRSRLHQQRPAHRQRGPPHISSCCSWHTLSVCALYRAASRSTLSRQM